MGQAGSNAVLADGTHRGACQCGGWASRLLLSCRQFTVPPGRARGGLPAVTEGTGNHRIPAAQPLDLLSCRQFTVPPGRARGGLPAVTEGTGNHRIPAAYLPTNRPVGIVGHQNFPSPEASMGSATKYQRTLARPGYLPTNRPVGIVGHQNFPSPEASMGSATKYQRTLSRLGPTWPCLWSPRRGLARDRAGSPQLRSHSRLDWLRSRLGPTWPCLWSPRRGLARDRAGSPQLRSHSRLTPGWRHLGSTGGPTPDEFGQQRRGHHTAAVVIRLCCETPGWRHLGSTGGPTPDEFGQQRRGHHTAAVVISFINRR